jgi:hypothetical protein
VLKDDHYFHDIDPCCPSSWVSFLVAALECLTDVLWE